MDSMFGKFVVGKHVWRLNSNYQPEDKVKLQGEGNVKTIFENLGKYMKKERVLANFENELRKRVAIGLL